jgi:hypothetical protein
MKQQSPEQIRKRRDELFSRLPPFSEILRGSLLERSVRCGKASCRCAEGQGHPVTYLSVTFPGGRTEQITVTKDLVPVVRRWVANYRRWLRAMEQVSVWNRQLLRQRQLTSEKPPRGQPQR